MFRFGIKSKLLLSILVFRGTNKMRDLAWHSRP
jgi:hypothetical protein